MPNPFKGLHKKANQETFQDEMNLKVTLPEENPGGSPRTTKASGSGTSLPGDKSTPNKRDREYSLDDPNPEKKLDDRKTPRKSSAESDDSDGESIQSNLTEKELIAHVEQVSLHDAKDNAGSYATAAKTQNWMYLTWYISRKAHYVGSRFQRLTTMLLWRICWKTL